MGMELEWRLQIMTEVGNAIMENGGLECEGGGTEYWRSFWKERTGGEIKDQGGPFEKKKSSVFGVRGDSEEAGQGGELS